MIKRNKAIISQFIIHKIGNKFNDTRNAFSQEALVFDEDSYQLMLPFLLRPFQSVSERFRFDHHADVAMNEMNTYAKTFFEEEDRFVETSKHVVQHLYEQSNSANIKTGDVMIALFEGIEYNEIQTRAIGVFKIENKSEFFQTFKEGSSFDILVQKGISTKKLDKGCLVIDYKDDEGYVVLSVDNNNYDAQYWTRHFLNVQRADDKHLHTMNYLDFCQEFGQQVLKEQYGPKEQGHFLAKTVDFMQENETVNLHDFKSYAFNGSEQETLFDDYKKDYESERDLLLRNQFHVSDLVLKRKKNKIKTEIKLDTHIQIKLDLDAPDTAAEYLEMGYDEEKKMKYYKVYFNEEQ